MSGAIAAAGAVPFIAAAASLSAWDAEFSDSRGMRVVMVHKEGSASCHVTSDTYIKQRGSITGERTIELFGLHGALQADGQSIVWSNNETWSKVSRAKRDKSHCPSLTCLSACNARGLPVRLLDMLSDRKIGCIDFTPGFAPAITKGPCAPAHPDCRPGYVVHDRQCVKKKDNHSGHDWNMLAFRQKLVASFAQQARPNPQRCVSPRIAVVGLWDYGSSRNNHFGNRTSIREFNDVCVASLTWEVPLTIDRFLSSGSKWEERPIAIPDAYFLMTKGYHLASLYFTKAGINVSRAAIMEAGERTPWYSKLRSVVWRGTTTSDVSGDRKRLVQAATKAVEQGRFNHEEVNIHFSEKFFERTNESNHSMHMGIADMVSSRGVFSVDGIGNEWTLPWKLLSNSVTLLVESRRVWQWYYPQLLPWQHYVPVRNDLSDFAERVAFVLDPANDAQLRNISEASTRLVAELEWDRAAAFLMVDLERAFACSTSGHAL